MRRILGAAIAVLGGLRHSLGASADSLCYTTWLGSQADADELAAACPTVNGNVVLATGAVGAIALDGVHTILGALMNANCDTTSASCNSGLTAFSSSTLASVGQNVTLDGLSGLTSVKLPQLSIVGDTFLLNQLPVLDTLSIPLLSSVPSLHIAGTPSLNSADTAVIRNLSSVYFADTALNTIPEINSSSVVESFVVSGMNNLSELLFIGTPHIGSLHIDGNGTMGVKLLIFQKDMPDLSVESIDTFTMSGCGFLDLGGPRMKTFNATATNLSFINLFEASYVSDIYIQDNPRLSSITFPDHSPVLGNVSIIGNPQWGGTLPVAYNFSNYILEGDFGNDTMLTLEFDYIFGNLIIQSTKDIDCRGVDARRKSGSIRGNYSCQGKTVAIGSMAGSLLSTFSSSVLALSIFASVLVF